MKRSLPYRHDWREGPPSWWDVLLAIVIAILATVVGGRIFLHWWLP